MDAERAPTDADRETAVSALRTHAGAGAIDLDGFGDRTAAVLAASSVDQLVAVFADLPGGAPALPSAAPAVRTAPAAVGRPQPWAGIPVLARPAPVVPFAVLFLVIWAVTGFGYFWPVWPILGISIGTLTRSRTCGRSPHWV